MEKKRNVDELVREINELTPIEKLTIQHLLIENDNKKPTGADRKSLLLSPSRMSDKEANEMLRVINESKYYTTIAQPQIHDPVAIAGEQGKELPDRYEPSHEDLDEIFGGFQSNESAGKLVEEIYRLRTIGVERESLNHELPD